MKINHTNKLIKSDAIGEFKLEEINKEAIERTLKYFNNNRRAAAQALGMSERTLYRKITEFGFEPKIKRKWFEKNNSSSYHFNIFNIYRM